MRISNTFKLIRSALIVLTVYGCVDSVTFNVPDAHQTLVVDGLITDEPGPYSVKLHFASNVEDYLGYGVPVRGASVVIFDDAGNSETLRDYGNGTYETTASGIQGTAGRNYHIEIQTMDGSKYQSQPELLPSGGTLDSLYFEFHHQEQIVGTTAVTSDGFNVYINATGLPNQQNFLRWKWQGTYKIFTHPELVKGPSWFSPPFPAEPLPCSGYIATGTYTIKQVVPLCTCCTCWATQYQSTATVLDDHLFTDGKFSRVNVAFIPVNGFNFFDKYRLEVQQFSLTQTSYEFWKLIEVQETSSSSLFQPPSSRVRGNVFAVNGTDNALGIFSASSVKRKLIYMLRGDIPLEYQHENKVLEDACYTFDSTSTLIQPSFWISD